MLRLGALIEGLGCVGDSGCSYRLVEGAIGRL